MEKIKSLKMNKKEKIKRKRLKNQEKKENVIKK